MATPALDPNLLPKTPDGFVKMVDAQGNKQKVHPEDVQNAMGQNWRLPTAAELSGKAAVGPTGVANMPSAPVPPPDSPPAGINSLTGQPQGILGHIKALAKGAAEAGGTMAISTADLLHHVIPVKALEATPEQRATTVPQNTDEKIGKFAANTAVALAPGGMATRVGRLAELGPVASAILRTTINAAGSGAVNKLQGGNFTTGAVAGGVGQGLAEGATAIAPQIVQSVLPGASRKTAQTILASTKGLTRSRIASSADEMAPQVVKHLEDTVGQVRAPVPTSNAVKVIDDAMKKAVQGNDVDTAKQLSGIRQRLLNTSVPGKNARPSEALFLRNTMDKLSKSLPTDASTSYSPGTAAAKARDILESAIEKAAPGTGKMHDTISGLIQGGDAAKSAMTRHPDLAVTLARVGVHSALGAGAGYSYGHSPGSAMTGAVLGAAATSPVTRMLAARGTPQAIDFAKALLLQAGH